MFPGATSFRENICVPERPAAAAASAAGPIKPSLPVMASTSLSGLGSTTSSAVTNAAICNMQSPRCSQAEPKKQSNLLPSHPSPSRPLRAHQVYALVSAKTSVLGAALRIRIRTRTRRPTSRCIPFQSDFGAGLSAPHTQLFIGVKWH